MKISLFYTHYSLIYQFKIILQRAHHADKSALDVILKRALASSYLRHKWKWIMFIHFLIYHYISTLQAANTHTHTTDGHQTTQSCPFFPRLRPSSSIFFPLPLFSFFILTIYLSIHSYPSCITHSSYCTL